LDRLRDLEGPRGAVFDADGTLWHGDVSESFTRWMIARGHFDGALWDSYARVNATDPATGCLKILEFYAGMPLEVIDQHVAEFWATAPERPWIDPTIAALRWLADLEFTVWIVSGTPGPVLRPLIGLLPIDADHILGLDLAADDDGRATGGHRGTPTFGAGKVQRITERTSDPISLAVGNSILDVQMMELSRDLRWAVNPDDALRAVAEQNNWLITEHEDPR
jgi:phosphoserine phosphatase